MRKLSPLDIRIPAWDRSDLETRVCPICGGAGESAFRRPDDLTVNACGGCGLWFVSPAPTETALRRFYATYDRDHRREPALPEDLIAAFLLDADPTLDPHLQTLLAIRPALAGLRGLDVGFGRGAFLLAMRSQGMEVAGVELDGAMVQFARRHLDIPAFHGTIDDLPGDQTFDVVSMLDLIEHPLEPLRLLEQVAARLNPSGVILLLTPNGTHLAGAANPVALRVDLEHMQYFSRDTIGRVAKELGLTVSHLQEWGHAELDGIDRPPPTPSLWKARVAQRLRRLPGGGGLVARRRRLNQRAAQAARAAAASGNYHLVGVLEKA